MKNNTITTNNTTNTNNVKENKTMMNRDAKGRFVSNKTTNNTTTNNTTNNNVKENKTMMNKEMRMETLKAAGVNTNNFFDVNVKVPMGSSVTITIDGIPYTVATTNGNEVSSIIGQNGSPVTDNVVEKIMEQGFVFNRKTDGRFVTAQTFKMLSNSSRNSNNGTTEYGWDAYLRNNFGYMYQFDMVADELHKLARMERENDPEFDRLSRFFTKDVVIELCKQYLRQLKKYVKNQPTHKCKGKPYVRLNKYGNVFVADLQQKVYSPIENVIACIKNCNNYNQLDYSFRAFSKSIAKLPYTTPKCSQWKDAFKGKGAYVTLLNIIKFHGLEVVDSDTAEVYNMYDSIAYVERKTNEYKEMGQLWRLHELLKYEIDINHFDLVESIEAHK